MRNSPCHVELLTQTSESHLQFSPCPTRKRSRRHCPRQKSFVETLKITDGWTMLRCTSTKSRSPARMWHITGLVDRLEKLPDDVLVSMSLILCWQVNAHFSPRVIRKERALHFHHLDMSLWSLPPFAATCNAICTEVRQGLPTNNSSSRSPESTLCATYQHRIFEFILHILFTYTRFAFENYRLLSISASCLFAYEYEYTSIFFDSRHLFLLWSDRQVCVQGSQLCSSMYFILNSILLCVMICLVSIWLPRPVSLHAFL